MDKRLTTLVAELAPEQRTLVERAIELAARLTQDDSRRPAAVEAASAALVAVGIAPYTSVVPLPSELTDAQRRMFEIVALAALPAHTHLFGGNRAAIERWLGLAPPSALEETVVHAGKELPLWRALVEIGPSATGPGPQEEVRARHRAKVALLDAMPFERALRSIDALLSFAAHHYGLPSETFFWGGELGPGVALLDSLGDEGVAWASAKLDTWAAERPAVLEAGRALLWLFAVVRGGRPIEPRWDAAFTSPISGTAPVSMFVTCALALPDARREAAIVATMEDRGPGLASQRVAVVALLREVDSERIAASLIEATKDSMRQSALEAMLAQVASTQPGVSRALTAWQATLAKPRVLKVTARVHPVDEAALSSSHAAQLAALRTSAPDDFDDPEMVGDLELRTLFDAKGKPAYDLWLFGGDSGVFFEARTTRRVAHRVQGFVSLIGDDPPDASLLAGLCVALKVTTTKAKPKAKSTTRPKSPTKPTTKPKTKPKK